MSVKTDEEIISMIKEYMANNKLVTRYSLKKLTGASQKRLDQLAAEGHFVYPPRVARNARHLYGKSQWANNFKLPNSH